MLLVESMSNGKVEKSRRAHDLTADWCSLKVTDHYFHNLRSPQTTVSSNQSSLTQQPTSRPKQDYHISELSAYFFKKFLMAFKAYAFNPNVQGMQLKNLLIVSGQGRGKSLCSFK